MGGITCPQTGSGRKDMESELPFFFRKKPLLNISSSVFEMFTSPFSWEKQTDKEQLQHLS